MPALIRLILLGAGSVILVAGILLPRRVLVAGSSMEPTLSPGDRLLVVRVGRVNPGDVVALRDPSDASRVIVKRVAAVRRGEVVVLGDNPEASTDSRFFGPVPARAVLGKALRRYGPAGRVGPVR